MQGFVFGDDEGLILRNLTGCLEYLTIAGDIFPCLQLIVVDRDTPPDLLDVGNFHVKFEVVAQKFDIYFASIIDLSGNDTL
jgi:hypothetical protein